MVINLLTGRLAFKWSHSLDFFMPENGFNFAFPLESPVMDDGTFIFKAVTNGFAVPNKKTNMSMVFAGNLLLLPNQHRPFSWFLDLVPAGLLHVFS